MVPRTNQLIVLPRNGSSGTERNVLTPGDPEMDPADAKEPYESKAPSHNFLDFLTFSRWGHPEMYLADPNEHHERSGPPATS